MTWIGKLQSIFISHMMFIVFAFAVFDFCSELHCTDLYAEMLRMLFDLGSRLISIERERD